MSYTVSDTIPDWQAWSSEDWTIDIAQTSYVPLGTLVRVTAENVTFLFQNGNTQSSPASITESGLVNFVFTPENDTTTANNVLVPAGTPVMMVMTMIILEDSNGTEDKHATVLTLVDDPDDAGVMGASGGGG